MTEPRDDYLWDRSGQPDAEIMALERLLRPLGHDGRRLRRLPRRRRWAPWLVLAAALLVALSIWWWRDDGLRPGAAARTFVALERDTEIQVDERIAITLRAGSRLRFEHWQKEQLLFRLEHGGLQARVAPPPAVQAGFFLMDTPHGRIVDMGCLYNARLNDDGTVYIEVKLGAVQFEFGSRRVFVPAGASTTVDRDSGPSLPMFNDTLPELRKSVRELEMVLAKATGDERLKMVAVMLETVVKECRSKRDTLVLWHLLRADDQMVRDRAERALLDLVDPPVNAKTKDEHWDAEVWLAPLRLLWAGG